MATTKTMVTLRQLEDALQAANAAALAYTQPVEVRPGVSLCAAGRVFRAMHLMKEMPHEKWAVATVEIDRLSLAADELLRRWIDAERHYRQLCADAGTEPSQITPGAPCGCEGCKLVQEGIEAVQRLPALPVERWRSFASMVDAQAAYEAVKPCFEAMIGVDREKDLFVLCAPPLRSAT